MDGYRLPTVLQVKMKPRSRVSALVRAADGTWLAHVKAAPVEGRANDELISLVAAHFRCRKGSVSIQRGTTARLKLVRIEAP